MKQTPNTEGRHRDRAAPGIWRVWELLERVRLVLAAVSVIAPIIFLTRTKIFQLHWERNHPTLGAERLIARGTIVPENAGLLDRACAESPQRPDFLRALASACVESDPGRARRCYEQIDSLGATTAEDTAGHAALLAKLHAFADAEALLGSAAADRPMNPVITNAKFDVRVQAGDTDGASRALTELCLVTPNDPDPSLEAALSCARAGADTGLISRAELHALAILSRWNEKGFQDDLAPRLQKLLDLPLQDPASREAAHVLMTRLPNPDLAQSIAAVALARPASFTGREQDQLRTAYIEVSQRRGGVSSDEKERLAAFLQHQGNHALVTELIAGPESLTERPLFQRRLDSLLHLGMWREAADLASDPKAPAVANQNLFTALSALNKVPSITTRTTDLLASALTEVTTDGRPEACFSIGCAALELNLRNLALEAFARAVHLAPADAQLVESITNVSRRSGLPVRELTAALTRGLATRSPGPLVAQRLCYLCLLADDQVETARELVRGQAESSLDGIYARFLDALYRYQHGDYAESFRLLMPLPNYHWHQGEAAVITGIICTAGGADKCAPLARNIRPEKLFPEERAIIEPWLARLSLLGNNTRPDQKHVAQR